MKIFYISPQLLSHPPKMTGVVFSGESQNRFEPEKTIPAASGG